MRDRVPLLALVCLLAAPAPAAADSLPSCPPGQRMDCHPSEHHHGCGGCVPIEGAPAREPRVEPPPEDPLPNTPVEAPDEPEAVEEPAPVAVEPEAAPARAPEPEPSGGCATAPVRPGGALVLALPLGLALLRRARGARPSGA